MQNAMTATLVGAETRSYRPFVDQTGKEMPAGITYRLHLVESFASAPIEVRCTPVEYTAAVALGAGAQVEALVEVTARDNRLGYRLLGLDAITAPQDLVSVNGKR